MSGESQQLPRSEPDPTVLTTDQLDKLEARLMAYINERFSSYDKTIMQMFASVDRRFKEMTEHRIEQKADSTKALDAAHTAAKEQISALSLRVDDNRDRITRVESTLEGKASQVVESRGAGADLRGLIGLGIAVMLAAITVIGFIAAQTP